MPALKPIRNEKFVREYIKIGVATEAYLKVYPKASEPAARMGAARMLARPHVKKRLNELIEAAMKRADVTIDSILTEYEEARLLAKSQEKSGEMQAASERKAKLVGLLRDRVEAGQPGEFDNMDNISEILEKVAAEVGPEAALALSKAFGLSDDPPSVETHRNGLNQETEADLAKVEPASDAVN